MNVAENLQRVQQRIQLAAARYQRPEKSIQLLAVSKRQDIAKIRQAYDYGQRLFGESYVSEALSKQQQLLELDIEWHFIGPIQSNKTRDIANHFNWVHSIDRLKVLRRISDQRSADLPPLNYCLQVKLGDEQNKSGIDTSELSSILDAAAGLQQLRLRGLMCIPPPSNSFEQQRSWFIQLKDLFKKLQNDGYTMDTLSMGMSADLEAAIAEQATMVRIGTDIFGKRTT